MIDFCKDDYSFQNKKACDLKRLFPQDGAIASAKQKTHISFRNEKSKMRFDWGPNLWKILSKKHFVQKRAGGG